MDNICPMAGDPYQLLDEEWVWETFKDDPVLKTVMTRKGEGDEEAALEAFGATDLANSGSDAVLYHAQTEAALFATRYVIEKASSFCEETGKKLLVLLSFSSRSIRRALADEPLFDQTFLDWLSASDYTWFDLREAFRDDYARHNVSIDAYLDPFYIGHHTPRGNFFFAGALKDRLVEWLEPKPLPYLD